MKRTLLIILGFQCLFLYGWAQSNSIIQIRSAEEEAEKQTEMMQRELLLTQEQHDTIFRMNLKYAKARRISNTRGEMLERLNMMYNELKQILTEEQYHQFMNCQLNNGPKRPVSFIKRGHPDTEGQEIIVTKGRSDTIIQSNK